MAEERRIVTVLFADMTGSTALGEARDPEDVRALLARYYDIAREVVSAHGGTLEKFIGDAVMAVFGLPQAHGDDAQRAMSAALEIRDRVRADPKLGPQQPVRIGVNTGEVVATRDSAASDFLITGDAVNVAARLQQTAEPWTILCGERTARAARDRFTLGHPTEIDVKGKQLPIQALPLLGRAAEATLSRFPLIGRDDDLAQLELVARRAFTDRRPFLVSLIAPAGTGKTRLVEEFLHRLPALAPDGHGGDRAVSALRPAGHLLAAAGPAGPPGRVEGRGRAGDRARGDPGLASRPRRRITRACGRPSRRDDRRRRAGGDRPGGPLCRLAHGHRGGGAPVAARSGVRGPALVERQPPRSRGVHRAAPGRCGGADDRPHPSGAARSAPGVGRRPAELRRHVARSPSATIRSRNWSATWSARRPRRSSSVSWPAPKATPSSRARSSSRSGSASAR